MWPTYLANPAYVITSSVTLSSLPSSTTWRSNRTQAEGTPRSLSIMACGIFLIFLTWSCFLQCCDSVFSLYINLLACVVVLRKELSLMGMNLSCVSSLSHSSLSLFLFLLLINVNFPGIENEHTDAFIVN